MPDGGRAAGLGRWTVALWMCAWLFSFPASAQLPSQISIDWTGTQLCPRSLGLEAEVARLLGPAPPVDEPTRFVARVDELADRSVNYYRLSLTVSSESRHAERSVELATCSDVADAAALLIASAIDPNAVLRAKPPPPPPPPPPAEPASEAEPARAVVTAPWSLRALGQLDSGTLPGVTGGPIMGALFQYDRYRAWLDARYLFARSTEEGKPVRCELDSFSAALGAAYVWPLGAFVVGPALEAEVGRLRSDCRDSAAVQGTDASTAMGVVSFGAVAAYAVDRRVGIELGLFAGVPLYPATLQVFPADPQAEPLYTTDPITLRLALGLRVSLGSP